MAWHEVIWHLGGDRTDWWCNISTGRALKTEMLWCKLYFHWRHRKLSLWKYTESPVTTNLASWQLPAFSEEQNRCWPRIRTCSVVAQSLSRSNWTHRTLTVFGTIIENLLHNVLVMKNWKFYRGAIPNLRQKTTTEMDTMRTTCYCCHRNGSFVILTKFLSLPAPNDNIRYSQCRKSC